jgi:hypothetical protein
MTSDLVVAGAEVNDMNLIILCNGGCGGGGCGDFDIGSRGILKRLAYFLIARRCRVTNLLVKDLCGLKNVDHLQGAVAGKLAAIALG